MNWIATLLFFSYFYYLNGVIVVKCNSLICGIYVLMQYLISHILCLAGVNMITKLVKKEN